MNRCKLLVLWTCLASVAACGDLDEGKLNEGMGAIRGTVLDSENQEVEDARVLLRSDLSAYVQTDAAGKFLLEEVPAGIHEVLAYSEAGTGASAEAIVYGDETTVVELRLAPTGRIGGKVTLAGETDHVGTLIYLPGTSFGGFTDHDGSFEFTHVVPGCYRLRAEHADFFPKEVDRVCVQEAVLTSIKEISLVPRGTECTVDGDCEEHQACKDGECVFDEGYGRETCDGADNDGDGLVDEGVVVACGQSQGECKLGISICLGGSMSDCIGGLGPVDEVCGDGLDNDCDGVIDGGECRPDCGNGTCDSNEDACTCPEDCHQQVECCLDEDCPPYDCGPCCLSVCDRALRVCRPEWLLDCCWNGSCEQGETPDSCPQDCGEPFCGNGYCDADEDQQTCPGDCGCDNISCSCPEGALTSDDHLFCKDGDVVRCIANWIEECKEWSCSVVTEENCLHGCGEPSGMLSPSAYCCPDMSDACSRAGWIPGDPASFCVGPDLYNCALACMDGCGCDEELVLLEAGSEQCTTCTPDGMPLPEDGVCCGDSSMLNSSFIPDNGTCNGSYCWEPMCAACGDGTCGAGENYCSCPEDCGGLTCVQEHGVAMEDLGIYDCCDGLIPVSLPGVSGCSQYMCVDCGDGICGLGETSQNCLADCGSCAEEGDWFDAGQQGECCPGLTLLQVSEGISNGQCAPLDCGVYGVCTKCGDGECGIGESFCSCPEDCQGDCVQAGGVMVADQGCCDGNPLVTALPLDGQGCSLYVCTECGNGSCDYGERAETCPADCSLDCVQEGFVPGVEEKCCDGLSILNSNFAPGAGSCSGAWCWYPVCANCGDGSCGIGENYCSCPEDCGDQTCVQEHGLAMDEQGLYDCCIGLTPVEFPECDGCHQYMCVDCGDGDCGLGETTDNCPDDCS